jgi:hypothetical protein
LGANDDDYCNGRYDSIERSGGRGGGASVQAKRRAPRLSFAGSEDGAAENGNLQSSEDLGANDDRNLRPARP